MIKHLFIISSIITVYLSTLSEQELDGWQDLTFEECTFLAENFSTLNHEVQVKQAKIQIDNDMNYIAILNTPETGDCLHIFTFISWNTTTPLVPLELPQEISNVLLQAISPVKMCSLSQVKMIFSVLLNNVDKDEIRKIKNKQNSSYISLDHMSDNSEHLPNKKDIHYISSDSLSDSSDQIPDEIVYSFDKSVWIDVDDDNLFVLSNRLSLARNNLNLLSAKMFTNISINYILVIQPSDNNTIIPCMIAVQLKPWVVENAFTKLNFDLSNVQSLFSDKLKFPFCHENIVNNILLTANYSQITRSKSQFEDEMLGIWDWVHTSTKDLLEEILPLGMLNLKITSTPMKQILTFIRYGMIIENKSHEQCVLFLRMNFVSGTLLIENAEENYVLNVITKKLFNHLPACPEDLNEALRNELNSFYGFKALARTYVSDIDEEILKIAGKSPFVDWKVITMQNAVGLQQFMNLKGTDLQPISGMFKLGQINEYVLIMIDEFFDACSMYMSVEMKGEMPLLDYSNLGDNDLTMLILENLLPCDISQITQSNGNFRLLI
jgi:hypothetical protein